MAPPLIVSMYLVAALTATGGCVFSWRRRASSPVASRAIVVVTLGLAWWAAVVVVTGVVPASAVGYPLVVAYFPGVCAAVAGFAVLAHVLADPHWRPRRHTLALLFVEPALLGLAIVSNGGHHLFLTSWELNPGGGWALSTFGPLFWVHTLYSYLLLGRGAVVVIRSWRTAGPLHRRQLRLVFAGVSVPFVGNVVSLAPWPVRLPDLTPIFFTVTALTETYAVFRVGLMDLVPLARGLVFDRLADGVLVLDQHARLVDLNPSAARVLGLLRPGLPAAPSGATLASLLHPAGLRWPPPDGHLSVRAGDADRVYDVQVTPIRDGAERPAGDVVVLHDVTALAAANEQLQRQLNTIEGLRADLAEQAVRDELTGLHNRRQLVAALDAALARTSTAGEELSLVIFDVDHFKSVNDRYGHAIGDEVLVAVAEALSAGIRPGDTLARHGGEEFVLLLPAAPLDRARERAEQLRRRCAEVGIGTRAGTVSVTISAGVASTQTVGPDGDALLRAADDALYAAKAAGRDRVVVG